MSLSNDARLKFSALAVAIAATYGVQSAREEFNVTPSLAQTLNEKITHSSSFLQRINVLPVSEIKGQKVMLGLTGPVTGRTNTNNADRVPRNAASLDGQGYELFETHSDVALKFATIDAWAKFPNFPQRYAAAVQKQIGLDRIMIGWNGTSVAATSDPVANPLLQDVNKGWLQIAREQAPEQVLTQGEKVAGKIQIGATGDYANLDALVHDVSLMIEEEHRDGGDLIAIIGRDLLAHDKAKLYAKQGAWKWPRWLPPTAACRRTPARSSRPRVWWLPASTTCRSTFRTAAGVATSRKTRTARRPRTSTPVTKAT